MVVESSELASLAASPSAVATHDLAFSGKGKLGHFASMATSLDGRKTSKESQGGSSKTTLFRTWSFLLEVAYGFSTGKVKPTMKGTLTVVTTGLARVVIENGEVMEMDWVPKIRGRRTTEGLVMACGFSLGCSVKLSTVWRASKSCRRSGGGTNRVSV